MTIRKEQNVVIIGLALFALAVVISIMAGWHLFKEAEYRSDGFTLFTLLSLFIFFGVILADTVNLAYAIFSSSPNGWSDLTITSAIIISVASLVNFLDMPMIIKGVMAWHMQRTYRHLGRFSARWQRYLADSKRTESLDQHNKQVNELVSFYTAELDPKLSIRHSLIRLVKGTSELAWALDRVENHIRQTTGRSGVVGTESARSAFTQSSDRVIRLMSEWNVAGGAARDEVRAKLQPIQDLVGLRLVDVELKLIDLETQVRLLPTTLGEMNFLGDDEHHLKKVTAGLMEVNDLLAPLRPEINQPTDEPGANIWVLSTADNQRQAIS